VALPLRVLFAASEAAPLTKTGGLADVAAALPLALRNLGCEVRVLLPGYPEVMQGIVRAQRIAQLSGLASFPDAELLAAESPNGQPLVVLACAELFQREGGPYLDASGRDWPDNALRFGLFSYVAAMLAGDASPIEWRFDIVHCNDWQSGLTPAYLHWSGWQHAPSLMTLHNLAYQGLFPPTVVAQVGLPPESFQVNGIEYYGNMSFLKAGLFYADRINTVSPTYAREIQTEALGFGLHGLLAARGSVLDGILNGIDTRTWDSATDPVLAANYNVSSLSNKAANKKALRDRFGLTHSDDIPLLGIVSRLIPQKGIDLVVECAHGILSLPAQLVVLGTGEAPIEQALAALAHAQPDKVAFTRGFDEALSHQIEAGADIFLMPSRFEPCGLNQMYSQHYGTPPVVHRTGGLADSVVDTTPDTLRTGSATGFVFREATSRSLFLSVDRAVDHWRQPDVWKRIQRNGMLRDFGWSASAGRYLDVYRLMTGDTPP